MEPQRHIFIYNETDKIDFKKVGKFRYEPLSIFVLKTFATVEEVPKGYRRVQFSRSLVFSDVGYKGRKGDWGEIIPYYPTLIFMLIYVTVVLVVGLIIFLCAGGWFPWKKKTNEQTGRTNGSPRIVRYAVVIFVLFLIFLFCWTIFMSLSCTRHGQKIQNMKDYILNNLKQPIISWWYEGEKELEPVGIGIFDPHGGDFQIIEKFSERIKISCLSKLENAMALVESINKNIYSMRIGFVEWMDGMRASQRHLIYILQQCKSETVINELQFRTFSYTFQKLDLLVSIESTMNTLQYVIIKLMDSAQPNDDIPLMKDEDSMEVPDATLKNDYKKRDHYLEIMDHAPRDILTLFFITTRKSPDFLPDSIFFLPWLGYLLIMMICICALLGVFYDVLLKYKRDFFYLITIGMISLFSIIILVSVFWHFLFSVTMYHNRSKYEHGFGYNELQVLDELVDSTSLTSQLEKTAAFLKNISYCDTMMKILDLEYLRETYENISSYINGVMEHKRDHANLSVSHLNRLRIIKTDPFHFSEFSNRAQEMTEACKQLQQIFEGKFENILDECQEKLQSFKAPCSDVALVDSIGGIGCIYTDKVFEAGHKAHVIRWLKVMNDDYPKVLAGIWVPIFITLVLLPLLMCAVCFLHKYPVHTSGPKPDKPPKEKKEPKEKKPKAGKLDKPPKKKKEPKEKKAKATKPEKEAPYPPVAQPPHGDSDTSVECVDDPRCTCKPDSSRRTLKPATTYKSLHKLARKTATKRDGEQSSISPMAEELPVLQRSCKNTKKRRSRAKSTKKSIPQGDQCCKESTADPSQKPLQSTSSSLLRLANRQVEALVHKNLASDQFGFSEDNEAKKECKSSTASHQSVTKTKSKHCSYKNSSTKDLMVDDVYRKSTPSLNFPPTALRKPKDCCGGKKSSSRVAALSRRSKQLHTDKSTQQVSTTSAPCLRSNLSAVPLGESHSEYSHPGQTNRAGLVGVAVTVSREDCDIANNKNCQDINMCRALCHDIVANILPADRNTLTNGNSNLNYCNEDMSDIANVQRFVGPLVNRLPSLNCEDTENQEETEGREPRNLRLTVKMLWRSKLPRKQK